MSDWKAGDRAVCVEKFNGRDMVSKRPLAGDYPIMGVIYLVTATRPGNITGIAGLFLAGMYAFNPRSGNECAYCARRFRKVVPACDRKEIALEANALPDTG